MNPHNDRRACEFHLLRYVPDAVRNEYVHIGVILREQSGSGGSGSSAPARRAHPLYPRLAARPLP